ncbi:hypothetical protein [uncultured Desulfovibrio sp.]|uniref:hypothetical protein n=1 Tax=uncultured Desulfovibrio sp. TaxID=167968 RepID=UPI00261C14B7|nr:hypothetical protein [uncultured Desulfovibrio sp.]
MEINELHIGTKISGDTLADIFKCSKQGGMRRSLTTNTLVLISSRIKSLYKDEWQGDILHYTGMGQKGNQDISRQNKTLAESNSNGVTIHLFEMFTQGVYTYAGIMKLAGEPYRSIQKDVSGADRQVYIFPLKRLST